MEEVPFRERSSSTGRSSGLPDESYAECNLKRRDHQCLETCFGHINDLMYGALSHSHLLLVLLSWANGAEWTLEDEPNLSKLLNPDGTFNTAAVAACDEDLADGLGMSDRHGTFRYYRNLGQERRLKFARRRASV